METFQERYFSKIGIGSGMYASSPYLYYHEGVDAEKAMLTTAFFTPIFSSLKKGDIITVLLNKKGVITYAHCVFDGTDVKVITEAK